MKTQKNILFEETNSKNPFGLLFEDVSIGSKYKTKVSEINEMIYNDYKIERLIEEIPIFEVKTEYTIKFRQLKKSKGSMSAELSKVECVSNRNNSIDDEFINIKAIQENIDTLYTKAKDYASKVDALLEDIKSDSRLKDLMKKDSYKSMNGEMPMHMMKD